MRRGRRTISGLLMGCLLLSTLHVGPRAWAEEADIIEPTFDPIDVRASRFEKILNGESKDTDELEYWAAFLLGATFLAKTLPSLFAAGGKTILNLYETSRKKAEMERASQVAQARHAERLKTLREAAEAYAKAQTAWEADKSKSKLGKVKQAGKRVAEAFNAIVNFENKNLNALEQQGMLRYHADTNSFALHDPTGNRMSVASENLSEELGRRASETCAAGYAHLAGDLSKLRWQRAGLWGWPALNATGLVAAAAWWRNVANRRREKHGGKSVLEIQSDKFKNNTNRLQKATDLTHQLETWDDPKWKEIKADFAAVIMEVLRHNEERIVEYYKKHVPAELQEMLNIEEIVHTSLHGEHATAILDNVLSKSMATAAKATLGEASPKDVMGIIGTKDIAKQETDTKSFLIIMYAEVFNRMWPKLAFKNTNGDSHMILISPIINDSLQRMRGVKLKIQKQQKKEDAADGTAATEVPKAAPEAEVSSTDAKLGSMTMPPSSPGAILATVP